MVGSHPLSLTSVDDRSENKGGPAYPKMIEEMDRELNNVIEDFDCAVYVEALRLANESSEFSFSQPVDS